MTNTTLTHKAVDMANNSLYNQDFISTKDMTLDEVELILQTATRFKLHAPIHALQNKVIANCFFEPSTRTRLSFEVATLRLGGQCIGFSTADGLSMQKGESFVDTIRMLDAYADAIVIRHPREGSARLAAEVANCPVINAGDGANQHPTQALLDLFTIKECQPQLNGLSIALVGDLKHGRTVHSLLDLCALFDMRIYLVSPDMLLLPDALCDRLKQRGLRFSFHQNLEEIVPKVDILYMTRIQTERIAKDLVATINNPYSLTPAMLAQAKPHMKILHPLPRLNELPTVIDESKHAFYFQQAANGVPVRQALLSLLLNEQLT